VDLNYFAPVSFFAGGFFSGGYYPKPHRGQIPWHLKVPGPTLRDLHRSRGRFQVEITAEELIAEIASRYLDDDGGFIADLMQEFAARYMDWEPQYAAMARRELDRQIAARDRRLAAEAKAREDWMYRRKRTVMRMG
jgi:hypothetical protein